jgi:hypothetical protein
MKSKNVGTFFFVGMGLLGSILLIFGLQFNGTMCDEIQKAGMAGIGIFAIWGVIHLVDAYMKQRELENM